MYDPTSQEPSRAAMTYDQMLERVRYEGAYPTRERAADAVRAVLSALGRQLTGDERVDLARRLPVEAALALTAAVPDTEQPTGWGFVKDLAARTGPERLARILQQLPEGYALLFGQARLRLPRPQPAAV
ncbi:DUF2267 domain-containing protein [Streptomyces sp. NPDC056257]|uniref:DUF2267 domain-containing protein n=1 Tax=Streptomyces sp. NPDC056257 TaxID=3345765 RepID=UPI0035D7CB30